MGEKFLPCFWNSILRLAGFWGLVGVEFFFPPFPLSPFPLSLSLPCIGASFAVKIRNFKLLSLYSAFPAINFLKGCLNTSKQCFVVLYDLIFFLTSLLDREVIVFLFRLSLWHCLQQNSWSFTYQCFLIWMSAFMWKILDINLLFLQNVILEWILLECYCEHCPYLD